MRRQPGLRRQLPATGDIFPNGAVSGTDCVIAARGTHTPKSFQHSIVDTEHRTDVYTASDGSGTFTLGINKVCNIFSQVLRVRPNSYLPNGDTTYTGDQCNTIVYKGSATVKGGPALYTNLHGKLSFTLQIDIRCESVSVRVISGAEQLAVSLHIDP